MKIYSVIPSEKPLRGYINSIRMLKSYFYIKNWKQIPRDDFIIDFFLDSGAFSAWAKKKIINIEEYAEFIKKNENNLTCYANLDDISDPHKTQSNQDYLESIGLNPIPVYHCGEPKDILESFLEKGYEYIALGGMVPISTEQLIPWLNMCFNRICNERGYPKTKIHGFGMTTRLLIKTYPWYSIDSTSSIMGAAMGRVYTETGELDLARKTIISEADKKYIQENFPEFTLQQLKEEYKKRLICNIRYMYKLEKELTENPPIFFNKQGELF